MSGSLVASLIVRTSMGSVETSPSRRGSGIFRILIASAAVSAVVVLGVVYGDISKVAYASAFQVQSPSNPSPGAGQDLYKQGTLLEAIGKFSEAVSSYRSSCNAGGAASCQKLGAMYEDGRGVEKDEGRAAQFYEKSCNGGDALGCASLAVLYMTGQGVAKDASRAVQLFQASCDGGNAFGCAGLGNNYMYGLGVAKDESRAVQFYQRAIPLYQESCDGGNALNCLGLGTMYKEGRGVPKDANHAFQLFQKSCSAGFAVACDMVKTIGVPPPPPPATLPTSGRIKVDGNIIEGTISTQSAPTYPPLARQARIQGNVILHAIIDRTGKVMKLEVVSGHPLLVQAAMDAVRQWRYKPTLLNGEPVEVDTTITVTFTMGAPPP